jgi:hypothetical protein
MESVFSLPSRIYRVEQYKCFTEKACICGGRFLRASTAFAFSVSTSADLSRPQRPPY